MRLALRLAPLLAVVALAPGCAIDLRAPSTLVAAADAVDRQFLEAFNKGDLDAVMRTFWRSDDLVSIGLDGKGAQGFDAVRANWAEMLLFIQGKTLEFTESHNDACGETVLGWGLWKMTVPTPNGEMVFEGRYSDVKAFKDGRWVYVMDHASVEMQPPGSK